MKKLIAIILVCVSVVFAEQIVVHNTPNNEYCIRIIDDDGDVWDKDANNFTVSGYTDANGFTSLTEDSNTPGRYYATFPPEISAGTYDILIYDSNVTDVNAVTNYDGGFAYDWDGSAEQTLADFTLTSGAVQADMVRINGELTSENNATLRLQKLDIYNGEMSGDAVNIYGKRNGVKIYGEGLDGVNINGNDDGVSIAGDNYTSFDLGDYIDSIYSKLPTGDISDFNSTDDTVNLSSARGTQIDNIENVYTWWSDGGRLDTILDNIETDTNELQTDWTDGGRLDLLIDDVPNTSEFEARTLATADYFDFTTDTVDINVADVNTGIENKFNLTNGVVDANLTNIDGDTDSVDRLKNRR